MLLQLRSVRSVDREDDLALQRDQYLRLARRVQFWNPQRFHLLLRKQHNVDPAFEFVDDACLQIFVGRNHCFAGATPRGEDVNDEQLGITLVEVSEEMFCIADDGGQLHLFL